MGKGYYEGMDELSPWKEVVVSETGVGFGVGAAGGLGYHFLKGCRHHRKLGTAFRLACQKAPQVGGAGAAFCATSTVAYLLGLTIRQKDDLYTTFSSFAIGGAAVRANHGIRSAACFALFTGSAFALFFAWLEVQRKEEDQSRLSHSA